MSTVDLTHVRWRKSSFSGSDGGGNDNCIEVAVACADWRKSSFSGGNGGGNDNCVAVAFSGPVAALRDSKNAAGPVLLLPAAALDALLAATRR